MDCLSGQLRVSNLSVSPLSAPAPAYSAVKHKGKPLYAYARSDKKDKPRVPITARLMADLMITAGADRYITEDAHLLPGFQVHHKHGSHG